MSKQATTFDLAKLLMCSQEQATAFRNEVNYFLIQRGHPAIPLEQICAVARRLDAFTVTSEQVADSIAGPAKPTIAIGVPNASDVPNADDDGEGEDTDIEEGGEDEWLDTVPADPATSSLSPEVACSEILTRVLALRATSVTYGQIEQIMAGMGLDPAVHDDEYSWVIEQLDEREILVVETLGDDKGPTLDVAASIEANLAEINEILRRVFGKHADDNLAPLTAEEQRRLLEVVQEGRRAAEELDEYTTPDIADQLEQIVDAGDQAYEQLLLHNRRLVASVVLQYGKRAEFLTMDDLMQEGMIGLARALDRFDLGSGWQLSTYAVWWIRQAVTRALADQDRTIRLPVHRLDEINRYRRLLAELSLKLDHEPTEIELAFAMRLLSPKSLEAIDMAKAQNRALPADLQRQLDSAVQRVGYLQQLDVMHPVSLDMTIHDHEESTLGDFVPDENLPSPEAIAFQYALQEQIAELLKELNKSERDVLVGRFGLDDGETKTLECVGRQMGITRERVRQIESKALRKLGSPRRSKHLIDYLDFKARPQAEI